MSDVVQHLVLGTARTQKLLDICLPWHAHCARMAFTIEKATRVGVIPWIDLYSESGCGKTYSSLLLARGIAGPKGRIGMLDSESGRGRLYADVIEGGYEVVSIEPPFSPARYIEAFQFMFASGFDVIVGDSLSHEWEGVGGVLDMAADIEERTGKAGLHTWKPKIEHNQLVQLLLRAPVPLICCIRAKYKSRQVRIDGKTQIIKDAEASPIQAADFIFEATMHGEIMRDHSLRITKCSHPELRKCFPDGKQITMEHGKLIAAWSKAPQTLAQTSERPAILAAIRDATASLHGWKKEHGAAAWQVAKKALQQWLTDELHIDVLLDEQTDEQLRSTLAAAKAKLNT